MGNQNVPTFLYPHYTFKQILNLFEQKQLLFLDCIFPLIYFQKKTFWWKIHFIFIIFLFPRTHWIKRLNTCQFFFKVVTQKIGILIGDVQSRTSPCI